MQISSAIIVIEAVILIYIILRQRSGYESKIESLKEKINDEKEKLDLEKKQLEETLDKIVTSNQELCEGKSNLLEKERKFEEKVSSFSKKMQEESENFAAKKCEFEKLRHSIIDSYTKKLEEITYITKEEAKEKLFEEIKEQNKLFEERELLLSAEYLKVNKRQHAQEILLSALDSIVVDTTNEIVTKAIEIPSEDIKGKLIGKEGRNIKAIENLLGVNLIIDDTPGIISISSFNSTRRVVAQIALEELISSGRINQVTIEETVARAEKYVDDTALEIGRETVYKFDITDMNSDLVMDIGRLHFRSSYGQNLLQHTIEAASIGAKLASELGLKPHLAARCILLHDIGKLESSEVGKSHVELGIQKAKNARESDLVINAIQAHHGDVEPESLYAVITIIADSASAGRIGSRNDKFDAYLERIEVLEKIALEVEGVNRAYALQGGRELRILVESSKIEDGQLEWIARSIKKRVEDELSFPGIIKINVIRETRHLQEAVKDNMYRGD